MKSSYNRMGVFCLMLFLSFIGMRSFLDCSDEAQDQDSTAIGNIEKLSVRYVWTRDGKASPAYIDTVKRTLYVWKGVIIRRNQVPNVGPHHRLASYNAEDTDFVIQEITPPVRFYVAEDGIIRIGCYDHTSQRFFQWEGINFEKRIEDSEFLEKYKAVSVLPKDIAEVIKIPIPDWFWALLFARSPEDRK